MLRMLVAVAVLSQVVSHVNAQDLDLHVRTVDLTGDPIPYIQVRIGDIESQSNSNGIATFKNNEPLEKGSFRIQVNLKADSPNGRIKPDYIGRVKNVRWDDADRFNSGFVIPLWEWGDVKSLGTAVVKNPDHYAVVLQYGKNEVGSTRVVAKFEGDAGAWIERWVPDLPAVTSPLLARSLYAALEPGDTVPQQFADEMEDVYQEVERMNQAARTCRRPPERPLLPIPAYPRQPKTEPPTEPESDPTPPLVDTDYPPDETDSEQRPTTTCKPVFVTEYREQRTVVKRPVTETVMQNKSHTIYEPVTTMRTEYCDQGSYVNQVVQTPGVSRNRLQWLPGGYVTDPSTGTMVYQRGGMHWVPTAPPATYQVQRQYVPNIVARQVPQTTYVQRVITRQEPVQVTRYVDEVVTTKVPVQVRKMVCEANTSQVPSTPTKTSYRQTPSQQVVYDDTGWVGVNGPR